MQTQFSPPYRAFRSVTGEWYVINANGGFECHAESRQRAVELAAELNSRRPIPLTGESDLDELRKFLREAPSDRTILVLQIVTLVTTLFFAAATVIALTTWMGG